MDVGRLVPTGAAMTPPDFGPWEYHPREDVQLRSFTRWEEYRPKLYIRGNPMSGFEIHVEGKSIGHYAIVHGAPSLEAARTVADTIAKAYGWTLDDTAREQAA